MSADFVHKTIFVDFDQFCKSFDFAKFGFYSGLVVNFFIYGKQTNSNTNFSLGDKVYLDHCSHL